MTASVELDKYLVSFSKRLKQVCLARGSAILAVVILTVGTGFAWYAVTTGFAGSVIIAGRLALLASITAIIFLLIVKPLRRLDRNTAREIERRTPAYAGRMVTYQEMQDRGNPLRELLAEDTLRISADHPVDKQIKHREFTLPGAIAGGCVAALLALLIAGPGLLNYSLRNLLAGWAFTGLLPPQKITVTPGDELIRRGGDIRVSASMSGFDPDQAQVHVKIGNQDWQTVAMVHRAGNFEFTFFSVRDAMQYYVSTTGIRSPAYHIKVVDLPDVRDLKITYHYPDWTRRAPETVDHGGDIRVIKGTHVDMEVITDKPLPAGLLVLNNAKKPLAISGITGRSGFDVKADGQYYIAAQLGNEQVRLTDDYFIKVLKDGKPDVRLVRPGRDWNASDIEEVTTQVAAKDDYGLQSLQLHYAVNGGKWHTVSLPVSGRVANPDYVFYLENMHPDSKHPDKHLSPGDIISYYAEAKDRKNTSQTDMYFIQVRPFDRRYTQSQQIGSGSGNRRNPQEEISQRQKEIIVSTWNLLRQKSGNHAASGTEPIKDNATLLSRLQETLAKRANTLAERTRARALTSANDKIKTFVNNLEQAASAMHPAAKKLAATDLQAAIQPEQLALQHLLRAESTFNDIQISFQRGQGNGGGSAGRDLSEMFNMEMDLQKNQYETGSSASRESTPQKVDDAMQKLAELARRQQQLANDIQRQRRMTESQRWQQEMLRRDAEKLQRQLQNMQQQQASRGPEGQSGQSSQTGSGNANGSSSSELNRRLNSAIRAMNEATQAAMRGNNSQQLQRAMQEAQRQLQQARDQIAADQQQSMQKSFQDMADSASRLYRQQERVADRLQEAVRQALATHRQDQDTLVNPLSYEEEIDLADKKRTILDNLQSLRQKMQTSAKNYRDAAPAAARELDRAGSNLNNSQIDTRLNIAATYIERGAGLYVAGSEGVVTQALKGLKDSLAHARSLAMDAGKPGDTGIDRALAQTRQLRRELQQLTFGKVNQANQGSQQHGQGNSAKPDTRAGSGTGTGALAGGGNRDGVTNGYGGWNGWRRPDGVIGPGYQQRINRDIANTAGSISPIIPELRDQGMPDKEISEMYRLLRQLTNAPMGGQKNQAILRRMLSQKLALLEQLEMRLEHAANKGQPGSLRSTVAEPVPAEYQEAVAEYYRRLSNNTQTKTK